MTSILAVVGLTWSVGGVLTQGGTVTADSIYNTGGGDPACDNCVTNNKLVDGKWPSTGFGQLTHCCTTTSPTTSFTWVNINMGAQTVVQTIFFVNREENQGVADRVIGSDFYVGDNSVPNLNTPCGAYPTKTGAYSCGGKIGQYLGLYLPRQDYINISQIRAYAYKPGEYSNYQMLTSSSACGSSTPLPNALFQAPLLSEGCSIIIDGTPPYYNMVFNVPRFVHAVTLVGHGWTDFIESKNWVVTAGSATGASITTNTVYGQYVDFNFDRQGKEIKVGVMATSVGVYRTDNARMSFRWIAIFTTASNCSGAFDWSGSLASWNIPITTTAQSITGLLVAKIDDCAVFHSKLVLVDGSALPAFMSYDVYTHILTVNVAANQAPATYTVKACANLNDKVTVARMECQQWVVSIYQPYITSLAWTVSSYSYQTEQLSTQVQFPLPPITYAPTTATTSFQFSMVSSPSFVTVLTTGSTALQIISPNPTVGSFTFQVLAKDLVSNLQATITVSLLVYSCTPAGLTLSPSFLTVRISSSSQTSTWSQTAPYAACGTYTASVSGSFASYLSVSGQIITASAPSSAATGTSAVTVTLARVTNPAQMTTASLSVTILAPFMTSLSFSPSTAFYYEMELSSSQVQFAFPAIVYAPSNADKNISFTLTGAPTFLTVINSVTTASGVVSTSAPAGVYSYTLKVTESVSGLFATLSASLRIYDCTPTQFALSPTSLTVRISGPGLTSTWSQAGLYAACGTYTVSVMTSFAYLIQVNGTIITAQAPISAILGTYAPVMTLSRASKPSQSANAALTVTVLPPLMTSLSFSLTPPATSFYFETELVGTQVIFDFTAITWMPLDADKSISFALAGAPSFLTLQQSGTTSIGVISPSPIAGTFNFQVISTDSVSNLSASLAAKIFVYDCRPVGFAFSPNTLSVSILGPTQTSNWSFTSVYAVCGSYSVSVEPAFTFLISVSGTNLSVYATWTSLGSFNSVLTLTRQNNPAHFVTATLAVTITRCMVTVLSFSTFPAPFTTLQVGIDSQAQVILFQTTQSPLCNNQVTFALNQSTNSFISVSAASISAGQISITNAGISHHGMYPLTLTASVDGQTASANLTVIIVDPCSHSVFQQLPSPLRDFSVMLSGTTKQTNTVKILTDVELQYPSIVCPIIAVIEPVLTFISISSDYKTLTVDEAVLTSLIPQSVQTYSFTLRVTSPTFPELVTQANYTFKVTVACTVTEVQFDSGAIADQTYEVDPTSIIPIVISLPVYRLIPCLSSMTYTRQLLFNAAPNLPSFITYSDQLGTVSVVISNPTDTGIYYFTVLATEKVSGLTNTQVKFKLTLTCTISVFYNSEKNVKNVNYAISASLASKAFTMPLPVFMTKPDYCLLTPYQLSIAEELTGKQPTFVNLDSKNVSIQTDDPSLVGSYTLRFTAQEMRQTFFDNTVSFVVNLTCEVSDLKPLYTDKTVFELIYVLRSAPLQFTMPTYTWQPANCKKNLEFKLENQSPGAASSISFPNFFKFDLATKKVSLNGDSSSFTESDKEFIFRFAATTSDGATQNKDYSFTIKTLFKNTPPSFTEALTSQVLTCSQSFQWKLPKIVDAEGDQVTSVSAKFTKTWLSFDESSQTFSFDGQAAKESNAGNYVIPITLTDQFGASATFKQVAVVMFIPSKEVAVDKSAVPGKNETSPTQKSQEQSQAASSTAQQDSLPSQTTTEQEQKAQAEASKMVDSVSSWDGWKTLLSNQNSNLKQVQSKSQSILPPQFMKIKSCSQLGLVLIEFGNPVRVPKEFNNQRRVLTSVNDSIKVLVKPQADQPQYNYTWNVTSFSQSQMEIQLMFEHAEQVSINFSPDILIVQVLDPAVYEDADGSKPQSILLASELPRQIKPGSVEAQFAAAASTAGAGAKGFVIGNFLLSLFMSASLNQLWSMVEAQQIAVIIPLFDITIPPSSAMVVQKFMEIASFDIIPMSWVWAKMFYMPPSQSLPLRYSTVGIEDSSLIGNIGSIFISLLVVILLFALAIMARQFKKCCKGQKTKGYSRSITEKAFWNIPITIVMESYMIVALSSLITIRYPNWGSTGQIVDTVLAYVLCVGSVVCLVLFPLIMHANRENIVEKRSTHLKQFEPLYEELNRENKSISVFRLIYLLRRVLLAVAIVQLDVLAFQLLLGFMQSTMTIIAIGFVEPYESRSKWIKELANEQIILATIYFAMCFSKLVPDPSAQSFVGYVFCGMMGGHIVSFLLVMFYFSLKETFSKCKRRRFIEKHKQGMVEQRMSLFGSIKKRRMVRSYITRLKQARHSQEPVRIEKIDVKQFASSFEGLSEIVTINMLQKLSNINPADYVNDKPAQADQTHEEEKQDSIKVAGNKQQFRATDDNHADSATKIIQTVERNATFQDSWDRQDTVEDQELPGLRLRTYLSNLRKQENQKHMGKQVIMEDDDNQPDQHLGLYLGHNRNESRDHLFAKQVDQMIDQLLESDDEVHPTKEKQAMPDEAVFEEEKSPTFKEMNFDDFIQQQAKEAQTQKQENKKAWGLQTQAMLKLRNRRKH